MELNQTKKENEALEYKMDHPQAEVKCPRCGKMLIYHSFGASCEVKCENNNCLHATLRGL